MSKTFYRNERYAAEEKMGRSRAYSAINRKIERQSLRDLIYRKTDILAERLS